MPNLNIIMMIMNMRLNNNDNRIINITAPNLTIITLTCLTKGNKQPGRCKQWKEGPTFGQCWATVADGGPALAKRWAGDIRRHSVTCHRSHSQTIAHAWVTCPWRSRDISPVTEARNHCCRLGPVGSNLSCKWLDPSGTRTQQVERSVNQWFNSQLNWKLNPQL